MSYDLPPKVWMPEAPAVIRPAEPHLLRPGDPRFQETLALTMGQKRHGGRRSTRVPELTYINGNSSGTDTDSYDFGSFTIPNDGLMIVGAAARRTSGPAGEEVASIVIDGTTVNNASLFSKSSSDDNKCAFAAVSVAAGSRSVVVTFPSTQQRAACWVWLARNLNSSTPVAQPTNTGDPVTSIATPSHEVQAYGFATYVLVTSGIRDIGWSAASERDEFDTEVTFAGADWTQGGTTGNHTETASWASGTEVALSGASWR